jgi:hypothetical protein
MKVFVPGATSVVGTRAVQAGPSDLDAPSSAVAGHDAVVSRLVQERAGRPASRAAHPVPPRRQRQVRRRERVPLARSTQGGWTYAGERSRKASR